MCNKGQKGHVIVSYLTAKRSGEVEVKSEVRKSGASRE